MCRYPLDYDYGWQINFHALQQGITPRTRGVIVVHPNNPTGHFTKPHELEKLNEICSPRNLAIIADEVFLDFALQEIHAPFSFAHNSAALTFTMSGLSKISGLPQMKAAWLVTGGPEKLKQQALARLEIIADTYLSMNAPVQHAIPALLDQRQSFQSQLLARVRKNLAELDRQLATAKILRSTDGGGRLVCSAARPCNPLRRRIWPSSYSTKKNVYVHPGHFYDFPSEGFLVVSLITREEEFARGDETDALDILAVNQNHQPRRLNPI